MVHNDYSCMPIEVYNVISKSIYYYEPYDINFQLECLMPTKMMNYICSPP